MLLHSRPCAGGFIGNVHYEILMLEVVPVISLGSWFLKQKLISLALPTLHFHPNLEKKRKDFIPLYTFNPPLWNGGFFSPWLTFQNQGKCPLRLSAGGAAKPLHLVGTKVESQWGLCGIAGPNSECISKLRMSEITECHRWAVERMWILSG